ncbi:TlpA family protein disulfide reductase [Streptomyces sp. NPDC101118]|uniref:TlpA family protein disulfide reductase n=1 Tax=Streptomyces sp. NPDC101118 TaxID=3366109 RepID=UPI00381E9E6E
MRRSLRSSVAVPVVAGLGVTAGLVLAGGITDPGGTDAGPGGPRAGVRTAATAAVLDPADRQEAPAVAGDDLDGKSASLATFKGEVVVVNVWGSWCAPCRAEADGLARLSGRVRGDGVRFLGINTRDRDRSAAREFVRAHGLGFPSIHDPAGELLLRFPPSLLNPGAIPSTLVVDRRGRIAAAIGGPVTEAQLEPLVRRVAEEAS